MIAFADGAADVLVCTTIIESGLDIPNANTIIIDRADTLGLAQLYQLRGRVGRSSRRAYAYLLYRRRERLSDEARKRLQAIFNASELGAGFQIALSDLEIRGAGNILGGEQSGHMAAVGFDLYSRLLAEAVESRKATLEGRAPIVEAPQAVVDLPVEAHLPTDYVPDEAQKLELYRRLARARSTGDLAAFRQEVLDRYGPMPDPVIRLIEVAQLRLTAEAAGVASISREEGWLVVRFGAGLSRATAMRLLEGPSLPGVRPSDITFASNQVRIRLPKDAAKGWTLTHAVVERLTAVSPRHGVACVTIGSPRCGVAMAGVAAARHPWLPPERIVMGRTRTRQGGVPCVPISWSGTRRSPAPELAAAIAERIAAGPSQFHVVVPATPVGRGLTWDEDEARAAGAGAPRRDDRDDPRPRRRGVRRGGSSGSGGGGAGRDPAAPGRRGPPLDATARDLALARSGRAVAAEERGGRACGRGDGTARASRDRGPLRKPAELGRGAERNLIQAGGSVMSPRSSPDPWSSTRVSRRPPAPTWRLADDGVARRAIAHPPCVRSAHPRRAPARRASRSARSTGSVPSLSSQQSTVAPGRLDAAERDVQEGEAPMSRGHVTHGTSSRRRSTLRRTRSGGPSERQSRVEREAARCDQRPRDERRRTAEADGGPAARHPSIVEHPARDRADGLWRPDRRALTLGLVLTITLVGFEALAISTVMPIVADELGGLELYGWVFSAFFLGSLIGIVVVGGAIDRGGLALPFALGLGLFAIGLLVGRPRAVDADPRRGSVRPGPRRRHDPADRLRRHRTDPARVAAAPDVRDAVDGLGPARRHRSGHRRHDRRDGRLAVRLPRPAAADRRSPARSRSGRCGRSRAPAHAMDERVAAARRGRCRWPCMVALGAGLLTVGLTSGQPVPTLVLSAVGLPVGIAALRRLTPAGTLRRPTGPPGRDPAARHPDLRVLRGRCLRRPGPRRVARAVGHRGGHRAHRGDHRLDGRRLDPGARRLALADESIRPRRVRGDDPWPRRACCSSSDRTSRGWSRSRHSASPGSAWAWPIRRSR